jgi:hypothetical protein
MMEAPSSSEMSVLIATRRNIPEDGDLKKFVRIFTGFPVPLKKWNYLRLRTNTARLCGLVVRVLSCSPRGPGFDSRPYQIYCASVGLERGPLSLVRINQELLGRKVAAPV